MGKTTQRKHDLEYFTIEKIEQVVRAGDQVLLKSPKPNEPPYVARVDKLESNCKRNGKVEVKARVQWYYKPEDTSQGRKDYHGTKELFLSNHYDTQSVDCILGKCTVHSFRDYVKLGNVGDEEFYCRFEYNAVTEQFTLGDSDWSCICGRLYNPDHSPAAQMMVQCYGCKLRFHPDCLNMKNYFGWMTCACWCLKCQKPSSVPETSNSHRQEQAVEDREKSEPEARKKTKRR